jgi:hypothetical protein
MKLAICYRGHLRTLSKTFENQKQHLFQDNEVDFFCHTWNIYDEEINFIKNVVKPKRLLVEDVKLFERNPYNTITVSDSFLETNFDKDKLLSDGYLQGRPYNVLSMLYSLNKVNSLRKEYVQSKGVEYDAVIVLRPDIYFYNDINYNNIDINKINISWFESIGDHLNNQISIIDHMAFSSEKNINHYCDCFLYVPAYYFNQKIPIIPEVMLGWHIKSNSFQINMIDTVHSVIRTDNYENYYTNIDK